MKNKTKLCLLLGTLVALTSCQIEIEKHYNKVHLFITNKCYELLDYYSKSADDPNRIVSIKDYGQLYLSAGTFIFIEKNSKCPICEVVDND